MRDAFVKTLEGLFSIHKDAMLLSADLGFRLFDDIRRIAPERFCNTGIAEANMIGVAAGLALSGKNVYCYSIIPFLVMRAFEQIRIDIDYHNLNVKLVGSGGGFTYGFEGFTHFAVEDIAVMRSLQNTAVVAPADSTEARALAAASMEYPGPLYMRFGRTEEPVKDGVTAGFRIGRAIVLEEGGHIAIIANGGMVHTAKQASAMLKKRGITTTVASFHTVKPLDAETLLQIASSHKAVFTIEEHSINGGLGSAVIEALSDAGHKGVVKRFGIRKLDNATGDYKFLRKHHGLDATSLFEGIINALKEIELGIGIKSQVF